MKKPAILLTLLVTLAAFALVAAAQAQVTASIQVKDEKGNVLNDQTVQLNTKINVFGTYRDSGSGTPATYRISIYLNKTSGLTLLKSWTGTVKSGDTVSSEQYILNQLGTYVFSFTAESGVRISCNETALASTTLRLAVPEPATIIAFTMGLGALGLYTLKRKRIK